jgi:hypothetical protein
MKLILIIVSVLLSGCVGMHHRMEQKTELCKINCKFENSIITSSYYVDDKDKPNQKRLLEEWGKPSEVKVNGNVETWHYYKNRWVGITPIFIIPIPLMLPVRDDEVEIIFKDKEFRGVVQKFTVDKFNLCSIIPISSPAGDLYCWSLDDDSQLSFDNK